MLFTNVMKTLILIAVFIAIPVAIVNFSRRHVSRFIQSIKTGPHRS